MLLERTLSQLDIGPVPPDRAQRMAHLGYMQWLGALDGDASYVDQARRALRMATWVKSGSPAVAAFCDLVATSMAMPPRPLVLDLPGPERRGGARARRLS